MAPSNDLFKNLRLSAEGNEENTEYKSGGNNALGDLDSLSQQVNQQFQKKLTEFQDSQFGRAKEAPSSSGSLLPANMRASAGPSLDTSQEPFRAQTGFRVGQPLMETPEETKTKAADPSQYNLKSGSVSEDAKVKHLKGGGAYLTDPNSAEPVQIDRADDWRRRELISQGLDPDLYQIDHIAPLEFGGVDTAENMQLMFYKDHQKKTKVQSVARRLMSMGEMSLEEARDAVLNWQDKPVEEVPDSIIEENSGFLPDGEEGDELAREAYEIWQQSPEERERNFVEDLMHPILKDKERVGEAVMTGTGLGAIPTAIDKFGELKDKFGPDKDPEEQPNSTIDDIQKLTGEASVGALSGLTAGIVTEPVDEYKRESQQKLANIANTTGNMVGTLGGLIGTGGLLGAAGRGALKAGQATRAANATIKGAKAASRGAASVTQTGKAAKKTMDLLNNTSKAAKVVGSSPALAKVLNTSHKITQSGKVAESTNRIMRMGQAIGSYSLYGQIENQARKDENEEAIAERLFKDITWGTIDGLAGGGLKGAAKVAFPTFIASYSLNPERGYTGAIQDTVINTLFHVIGTKGMKKALEKRSVNWADDTVKTNLNAWLNYTPEKGQNFWTKSEAGRISKLDKNKQVQEKFKIARKNVTRAVESGDIDQETANKVIKQFIGQEKYLTNRAAEEKLKTQEGEDIAREMTMMEELSDLLSTGSVLKRDVAELGTEQMFPRAIHKYAANNPGYFTSGEATSSFSPKEMEQIRQKQSSLDFSEDGVWQGRMATTGQGVNSKAAKNMIKFQNKLEEGTTDNKVFIVKNPEQAPILSQRNRNKDSIVNGNQDPYVPENNLSVYTRLDDELVYLGNMPTEYRINGKGNEYSFNNIAQKRRDEKGWTIPDFDTAGTNARIRRDMDANDLEVLETRIEQTSNGLNINQGKLSNNPYMVLKLDRKTWQDSVKRNFGIKDVDQANVDIFGDIIAEGSKRSTPEWDKIQKDIKEANSSGSGVSQAAKEEFLDMVNDIKKAAESGNTDQLVNTVTKRLGPILDQSQAQNIINNPQNLTLKKIIEDWMASPEPLNRQGMIMYNKLPAIAADQATSKAIVSNKEVPLVDLDSKLEQVRPDLRETSQKVRSGYMAMQNGNQLNLESRPKLSGRQEQTRLESGNIANPEIQPTGETTDSIMRNAPLIARNEKARSAAEKLSEQANTRKTDPNYEPGVKESDTFSPKEGQKVNDKSDVVDDTLPPETAATEGTDPGSDQIFEQISYKTKQDLEKYEGKPTPNEYGNFVSGENKGISTLITQKQRDIINLGADPELTQQEVSRLENLKEELSWNNLRKKAQKDFPNQTNNLEQEKAKFKDYLKRRLDEYDVEHNFSDKMVDRGLTKQYLKLKYSHSPEKISIVDGQLKSETQTPEPAGYGFWEMKKFRERVNQDLPEGEKITANDFHYAPVDPSKTNYPDGVYEPEEKLAHLREELWKKDYVLLGSKDASLDGALAIKYNQKIADRYDPDNPRYQFELPGQLDGNLQENITPEQEKFFRVFLADSLGVSPESSVDFAKRLNIAFNNEMQYRGPEVDTKHVFLHDKKIKDFLKGEEQLKEFPQSKKEIEHYDGVIYMTPDLMEKVAKANGMTKEKLMHLKPKQIHKLEDSQGIQRLLMQKGKITPLTKATKERLEDVYFPDGNYELPTENGVVSFDSNVKMGQKDVVENRTVLDNEDFKVTDSGGNNVYETELPLSSYYFEYPSTTTGRNKFSAQILSRFQHNRMLGEQMVSKYRPTFNRWKNLMSDVRNAKTGEDFKEVFKKYEEDLGMTVEDTLYGVYKDMWAHGGGRRALGEKHFSNILNKHMRDSVLGLKNDLTTGRLYLTPDMGFWDPYSKTMRRLKNDEVMLSRAEADAKGIEEGDSIISWRFPISKKSNVTVERALIADNYKTKEDGSSMDDFLGRDNAMNNDYDTYALKEGDNDGDTIVYSKVGGEEGLPKTMAKDLMENAKKEDIVLPEPDKYPAMAPTLANLNKVVKGQVLGDEAINITSADMRTLSQLVDNNVTIEVKPSVKDERDVIVKAGDKIIAKQTADLPRKSGPTQGMTASFKKDKETQRTLVQTLQDAVDAVKTPALKNKNWSKEDNIRAMLDAPDEKIDRQLASTIRNLIEPWDVPYKQIYKKPSQSQISKLYKQRDPDANPRAKGFQSNKDFKVAFDEYERLIKRVRQADGAQLSPIQRVLEDANNFDPFDVTQAERVGADIKAAQKLKQEFDEALQAENTEKVQNIINKGRETWQTYNKSNVQDRQMDQDALDKIRGYLGKNQEDLEIGGQDIKGIMMSLQNLKGTNWGTDYGPAIRAIKRELPKQHTDLASQIVYRTQKYKKDRELQRIKDKARNDFLKFAEERKDKLNPQEKRQVALWAATDPKSNLMGGDQAYTNKDNPIENVNEVPMDVWRYNKLMMYDSEVASAYYKYLEEPDKKEAEQFYEKLKKQVEKKKKEE